MIQSCTLNSLTGNPDGSMAYVACQMGYGAEPSGREVVKCRMVNGSMNYFINIFIPSVLLELVLILIR